jgi:beta-galactosidase
MEAMENNAKTSLTNELVLSKYETDLWTNLTEEFAAPLDVVGYNYLDRRYESDAELFPDRVICGTESMISNYDTNWERVERFPHVIGDFAWTSCDYLGEAGIGKVLYFDKDDELPNNNAISFMSEYPWRVSNDADFDICGFDRPQLAFRRVVWGSSETYIAVHNPEHYEKVAVISSWGWPECMNSWNWKGYEGKPVLVDVYSSANEVELMLNGKSLGKVHAGKNNRYKASFEIVYEPGTLRAISYTNGKEVSNAQITTTGTPAAIRLVSDKKLLIADGQNLAFVVVEITDNQGNRVPDAEFELSGSVTGYGSLAAFGSARPKTVENYTTGNFTSYEGRLLAIIRAGYEVGKATLKVSSKDLETIELNLDIIDGDSNLTT